MILSNIIRCLAKKSDLLNEKIQQQKTFCYAFLVLLAWSLFVLLSHNGKIIVSFAKFHISGLISKFDFKYVHVGTHRCVHAHMHVKTHRESNGYRFLYVPGNSYCLVTVALSCITHQGYDGRKTAEMRCLTEVGSHFGWVCLTWPDLSWCLTDIHLEQWSQVSWSRNCTCYSVYWY